MSSKSSFPVALSVLPSLSAAALGTLDFSLLYDQENNALHCTIAKAKVGPLAGAGRGGSAQPSYS